MVETAKSQIPNEEKKKIIMEEHASKRLLPLSFFKSSLLVVKSKMNRMIKTLLTATINIKMSDKLDISYAPMAVNVNFSVFITA